MSCGGREKSPPCGYGGSCDGDPTNALSLPCGGSCGGHGHAPCGDHGHVSPSCGVHGRGYDDAEASVSDACGRDFDDAPASVSDACGRDCGDDVRWSDGCDAPSRPCGDDHGARGVHGYCDDDQESASGACAPSCGGGGGRQSGGYGARSLLCGDARGGHDRVCGARGCCGAARVIASDGGHESCGARAHGCGACGVRESVSGVDDSSCGGGGHGCAPWSDGDDDQVSAP